MILGCFQIFDRNPGYACEMQAHRPVVNLKPTVMAVSRCFLWRFNLFKLSASRYCSEMRHGLVRWQHSHSLDTWLRCFLRMMHRRDRLLARGTIKEASEAHAETGAVPAVSCAQYLTAAERDSVEAEVGVGGLLRYTGSGEAVHTLTAEEGEALGADPEGWRLHEQHVAALSRGGAAGVSEVCQGSSACF